MATLTRHKDSTHGEEFWQAIIARSTKADGRFVYAVSTTGVFCRPSCAARHPRRENVRFYDSPADAERDGYRPCKRCHPRDESRDDHQLRRVVQACRLVEKSGSNPDLNCLASTVGISPSYLHRLFKSFTGLTPRQYASAHREGRLRAALRSTQRVTDAIFDAGYASNSRFYERADDILGMTPSAYRSGGKDTTIRFAIGESSLGSILVAQSARGICAILLGDTPEPLIEELENTFPNAELIGNDVDFAATVARVVGFVEAPNIGLKLPLDIRGTAFQQRVWAALREIPSGATASYAEIAAHIGAPRAARAVAQACSANRLAVAIPCHRVIRRDGNVSGYRWGIDRKRALLAREAQN